MTTFRTPVEGYNGISAGVRFTKGVGQTDDPRAIQWLTKKGYLIIEDPTQEVATEPVQEIPASAGPAPRRTRAKKEV